MKRIVVKIGTNVITKSDGSLNVSVLKGLVDQIARIKKKGYHVIVVSSGAMAAGRAVIGTEEHQKDKVVQRQLLTAVGQVHLVSTYDKFFVEHKLNCAQVLATKADFKDRSHYMNMKNCFEGLLRDDIIPIVNENDVVAVEELMFTDNDELAGLVAGMMDMDALLVLTNVDGVMKDGEVLTRVEGKIDDISFEVGTSLFGRGGMQTKWDVATKMADLGITTYIVRGDRPKIIERVLDGEEIGTVFAPRKKVDSKRKWIAASRGHEKGVVYVNDCAEDLFVNDDTARSLLPVGIEKIEGSFEKGDVIKIVGASGKDVGYGVAQYGVDKAKRYIGKKRKKALIHYNYLYIEKRN